MTHSITQIKTGTVCFPDGTEINNIPIKIRQTSRVVFFVKDKKRGKVYISESLAMDRNYKPERDRFKEVSTEKEVQWRNIMNNGRPVWWNPINGERVHYES